MANFMAWRWPATSTSAGCWTPAAHRAAALLERRPRLHLATRPLLDRAGARRARLPARDAGRHPGRRAVPAARRAGRRGRRAGPGGRPDAVRDRRRRRLHEHRARSTRSASWPTSPRPRTCGSTSTRPTAAAPGCRPATPAASRTSTARDSVTVDPHKWFFQAYDIGGLLVRDGRTWPQAFGGRAPEYYRGGERTRPRPTRARDAARRGRPRRPAQLLQAQLRGHPSLARAQAVDVAGSISGPRASAG